jgi:hypothetical protein
MKPLIRSYLCTLGIYLIAGSLNAVHTVFKFFYRTMNLLEVCPRVPDSFWPVKVFVGHIPKNLSRVGEQALFADKLLSIYIQHKHTAKELT